MVAAKGSFAGYKKGRLDQLATNLIEAGVAGRVFSGVGAGGDRISGIDVVLNRI